MSVESTASTLHPVTLEELEIGLEHILLSPQDAGRLELIVRRPQSEARESLAEGQLDPAQGLVGDNWGSRVSAPLPETQVTLMNSRVIALLAQTPERWPLAGDQLYVDLDLSAANLPPGTRLAIGAAVLEISAVPHTGCQKFEARFGRAALKFINAPVRRDLRLRGLNARVVQAGLIRRGDLARKI